MDRGEDEERRDEANKTADETGYYGLQMPEEVDDADQEKEQRGLKQDRDEGDDDADVPAPQPIVLHLANREICDVRSSGVMDVFSQPLL